MHRVGRATVAAALAVLAAGCSSGGGVLVGTWQMVSYIDDGQVIVVEEGVNASTAPFFRFDGQYVDGNAGCNNFGDDDDYAYTYADGVLNLGVLVKDASECEAMTTELFLEDVIWSDSDISVNLDGQTMAWEYAGETLKFEKRPDLPST